MMNEEEKSCKGCEFQAKCIKAIYGHLGAAPYPFPKIEEGSEPKEWCSTWRDLKGVKEK